MPSTNQVISRLQNQRSRIQGMLSPGKKHPVGDPLHAPLSPVKADFAGRKFQLAAKKMRTLDAGKLGNFIPGMSTSLGALISAKFQDVQKIIHFNPVSSRTPSLWSPLETTLPDGKASYQEAPAEPGVMRQGSIIQKFSMTPKPGQSLESFKEQVQAQPASSKPVKKATIDPGSRLFSRVQEVTPGGKQTLQEAPGLPVVPVQPVETDQPTTEVQADPKPATIQPQSDPSAPAQKTDNLSGAEPPSHPTTVKPSTKVPSTEMPLRDSSQDLKPAERTQPPSPSTDQPSELPTNQPVQEQKVVTKKPSRQSQEPTQSRIPVQKEAIPQAIPLVKEALGSASDLPLPLLKKALPVKKDRKQPQRPVARPTVQRQADSPVSTAGPKIQPQTAPTTSSDPLKVPQTPQDLKSIDPVSPEKPLKQHIDYRKQASRVIRALEPERLKPTPISSLIHRIDAPLVSPAKYSSSSAHYSRPELPALPQPPSIPKQGQPVSAPSIPQILSMDLPHWQDSQSLHTPDLPLAKPQAAQVSTPATSKILEQPEQAVAPDRPPVEQISQSAPEVAHTSNVVQRMWEEHQGLDSQSSSEGSDQSTDEPGSQQDLEVLAENVFPYIKRILEIEANRSSRNLR